jgi:hypothetical protein
MRPFEVGTKAVRTHRFRCGSENCNAEYPCDDRMWNPQTVIIAITCLAAIVIIILAACIFLGRVNKDNAAFYQSVDSVALALGIPPHTERVRLSIPSHARCARYQITYGSCSVQTHGTGSVCRGLEASVSPPHSSEC